MPTGAPIGGTAGKLKLFHRTTRRVELTSAGFLLMERIAPLAGAMTDTLQLIQDQGADLGGTLRICVQTLALDPVLEPSLVLFAERHPGVTVEVEVREGRTDLLASGFDLGIRLGEFIENDMVAVRIPQPVYWRIVGNRAYLDRFGRPEVPKDLVLHRCIRRRWPGQDQYYRWEFAINRRSVLVDPPGRLTVSSFTTAMRLSLVGHGLCHPTREMSAELARTADIEEVLLATCRRPTTFSPISARPAARTGVSEPLLIVCTPYGMADMLSSLAHFPEEEMPFEGIHPGESHEREENAVPVQ